MRLHLFPSYVDEEIILGTRKMSLMDFWDSTKKVYKLDEYDENYLLLSNTRRCQLIFSGYRQGDIMYITKLIPLADNPKIVWKRLMRLLEVKHIEVYTDPDSNVEGGIARSLGLTWCGVKVEFTPYDVSRFCTRAPMVREQDNCSLEEIEEVCRLVKDKHLGYKTVLSELAMGLNTLLVRSQNGIITSVAFIGEVGDIDTVSNFISRHSPGSREHGQDFAEFFRYMLNRCGIKKRKLRISLAPNTSIPTYDGIYHEVVMHSYALESK